ncbi:MAG: LacI family DNA-binding transcriptional regulator [Plantibacter flavus]
MGRVGIREVATLADVSMGTVSHYINHPDRVSP